MSSRVRALVWEELRTAGVLALWVFAGGAIGLLCMKAAIDTDLRAITDPMVQVFAVGGPLCLAIVLTVSRTNMGDLSHAFSTRILRLPVPTRLAVAVPLAVRALLMFLVTMLLALESRWLFGEGDWGVWDIAFLLTEGYLVLQALIWLGGEGLANLLLGALAIAGFVLFLSSNVLLGALVYGLEHAATFPVPAVVGIAAMAIAVPAVKATRGGRGVRGPGSVTWPALFHGRACALPPFSDALAAQQWFHRRREVRNLVVTTGGVVAFVLGAGVLLALQRDVPPDWTSMFGWVLGYLAHLSVLVGCFLYGVQGFSRSTPFACRYPMSSGDLAKAKLVAVGKVFGAILLLAFTFGLVVRLFVNDAAVFSLFVEAYKANEVSLREVVRYVMALSAVVGLTAWVFLSFHTRTMLVAALGLPLLLLWTDETSHLLPPAWIALSVYTWANAWRRRLVLPRTLVHAAAVWFLLTLLLLATGHESTLVEAIGFASLGPLAFVATVLDITRNRHGSRASATARPQPLEPAQRCRRAAAFAVAAGFLLWLSWPATPAHIATWRAQGLPATLDDLNALYPAPPESERTPSPYEEARQKLTAATAAFFADSAMRERFSEGGELHLLTSTGYPKTLGEPIDEETWSVVRQYYEVVVQPIVPLLDEAAAVESAAFQHRGPVLEYAPDPGPHQLGSVLQLEAFVAAMEDRPDGAAAAIQAHFPMAAYYREAPQWDVFWEEFWIAQRAAQALEQTLRRTELSAPDLAALQAAFAAARPGNRSATRGVAEARVASLVQLERVEEQDSIRNGIPDGIDAFFPDPLSAGLLGPIAITRSAALAMEALERGDTAIEEIFFGVPLLAQWLPEFRYLVDGEARARAHGDIAAVGAALERYRLAHGDWPGALDALVPAYLDAVPADPYSKRPLRYRQTGDGGCIVYSVGQDQRDDGGQGPGPRDWRGKDIPFRLVSEAQRAAAREIVPAAEDAEGDKHDDR